MSGAWDAMLAQEERENDPTWAFEAWRENRIHGHVRYTNHHRQTWAAAIRWTIARQLEWESLCSREAIRELRKGPESLFYPLFKEDPRVWVDCPLHARITVGVDGYCDQCGFDFDK